MAFNGHKNWNHWNVSLWINNDEGLYNLAKECIILTRNREEAAACFIACIEPTTKTPDGAKYTRTAVKAAMVGM